MYLKSVKNKIITHISTVHYLVSARLALVASDEKAELVLLQKVGSHVRSEVGTGTAKGISYATPCALWV